VIIHSICCSTIVFLFFSFLFLFFFFFFFLYFDHIYCIIVIYIAISYIHDTFSNFRSSFGQNLQTSSYFWENFFAISVSIFALLLFLYFIGNVQVGARSTSVLGFRALDYIFIDVQHYIYRWFRSIYIYVDYVRSRSCRRTQHACTRYARTGRFL